MCFFVLFFFNEEQLAEIISLYKLSVPVTEAFQHL